MSDKSVGRSYFLNTFMCVSAGLVEKLWVVLASFPSACTHALHSSFGTLYIQPFLYVAHALLELWVVVEFVLDFFN